MILLLNKPATFTFFKEDEIYLFVEFGKSHVISWRMLAERDLQ